jgi:hypothetical protein
VGDIKLLENTVDAAVYRGATEQIEAGTAVYVPSHDGQRVRVDMPGKAFYIETLVHGADVEPGDVGLLLWRQPGEPFICIEPTVGYLPGSPEQPPLYNTGAYIGAHGGTLGVCTIVRAL